MKISLGKFYREVTGTTTQNRGTTVGALTRWRVPFDADAGKGGDAVDIVHIDMAKAVWATEQAAAVAARGAKANGHGTRAPGSPSRLDDMQARMQAIAECVARIEETTNQIRRRIVGQ